MNKRLWWCVDCLSVIALDVHGRCEVCDSDAVTHLEHQYLKTNPVDRLIAELEAAWQR